MRLKIWTYTTLIGVALSLLGCAVSSRRGGFSAQMESSQEGATWLYSEGIRATMMGADSAQSASLFARALKKDSTHAPSWYELANLNRRSPQKGLEMSLKAYQLDSTNSWYQDQLGHFYIVNNDYDKAITVYQKLLESTPNNPEIYSRLAALYSEKKQPYAAIAILDSAETRFGITEMLSGYKRQLLMGVRLYDKAISETKQLIESFPYDPSNWVAMGEIYATMGRDSLAQNAYKEALLIDSTHIQTIISLNEFYKRKGDNINFLRSARELLRSDEIDLPIKIQFIDELTANGDFYREYYTQIGGLISILAMKHPQDFEITSLYGDHLISGRQIERAANLYKAQLNQSDTTALRQAFSQILGLEAFLGRTDSLEKYTTLAIKEFPTYIEFYLRAGNVLSYNAKKYAQAEAKFLQALELTSPKEDSLRSLIYGLLGDNAQGDQESEKAIRYYRLSLKHKKDNPMILNNYAYLLSEMNTQLKLAEKMSDEANLLSPNNATFLDTRAWIHYRNGEYKRARKVIKEVVSLEPNAGWEVLLHYGDIMHALGDQLMATFYWNKALNAGADKALIEQRLNPTKE